MSRNHAHLGHIISARRVSVDDQLNEEKESLSNRDVFGRAIKYESRDEDGVGPFVHYVRDLAKDLPKDAVVGIDSFDSDMIESYQIADDTLRDRTGIIKDEEQGQNLLHYIRSGSINFTECCRVKRDLDEAGYRRWLSDELARVKEESKRQWQQFMDDFGPPPSGEW